MSSLRKAPVKAADAANTTATGVLTGKPDSRIASQGFSQGMSGGSTPSLVEIGRLMADKATVNSNGGLVSAAVTTFGNTMGSAIAKGIQSVFSGCSNCKILTTGDIEARNRPTKSSGEVFSMILANSSLDYFFPKTDAIGIFAWDGAGQAGSSGKVFAVSSDGSSSGMLGLARRTQASPADLEFSVPRPGWHHIDQALRAMSEIEPGNPEIPIRHPGKSNLAYASLADLTIISATFMWPDT